MPKRADLPSSKQTLPIYDEDWDLLQAYFGPGGLHSVGVGPFIREVVHRACQRLRQRAAERRDEPQAAE